MIETAEALRRLKQSKFRRSFKLTAQDQAYLHAKGYALIRTHAQAFVKERLAAPYPKNDGKQTPFHGHPVFTAQHACACCCRGCLAKWHHIPRGIALDEATQEAIVDLLMAWLQLNSR